MMIPKKLRIATRKSQLALWQANHIKSLLQAQYPTLEIELLGMTTEGDQHLETPLFDIGGKGLFVKELEKALLDGRADIAVHSMKDVPMEFPKGLGLPVICKREDPRDVFVSNQYAHIDLLPNGVTVGTSSLRRQCQLHALHPNVITKNLRGNVNSRLQRMDEGQFDAIILAAAGLSRLNLTKRIRHYLEPEQSLPAAGQGALGIECRSDDTATIQLITFLNDAASAICIKAERAVCRRLVAGCQVPVAAFATLEGENLRVRGLVGEPDGSLLLRAETIDHNSEAEKLGIKVAENLLQQGAQKILEINCDD